jgi:hypothetical protein
VDWQLKNKLCQLCACYGEEWDVGGVQRGAGHRRRVRVSRQHARAQGLYGVVAGASLLGGAVLLGPGRARVVAADSALPRPREHTAAIASSPEPPGLGPDAVARAGTQKVAGLARGLDEASLDLPFER